jgi:thioredoxin:protein disulfide reductase
MIYSRLLTLLLFLGSLLNGSNDFLMPNQAFKVDNNTTKENIIFNLKLADSIYIYNEQLIINIIQDNKKINITNKVNIPKPQEYHESQVHFGTLDLKVSKLLIQQITNNKDAKVEFNYQGCSKAGVCYQPMKQIINYKAEEIIKDSIKVEKNESGIIADTLKDGSIFLILLSFFGFGLLLSLTPCIFPMIPILSSIIVSHSCNGKNMNAKKGLYLSVIYILSMSVAYTIAGVIAGLFGANLQVALQNPIVLVSFSALFVALAISMFGYYEIALPSSWQTKIDKFTIKSDDDCGHGFLGVAIMGFLSALIVGPCVAPPLAGALVYISQTGDAILGGTALFVMSIGMGLPLLIVGAGTGKYMPKPGGWMDAISKVFGVVMLGVAIWMIERVIPISITFILWMFLFFGAGIYLFKFKNMFSRIFTSILLVIGIIFGIGFLTSAKNILNPLENIMDDKKIHLKFKKVKTVKELDKIIANSNKPIMLDFYADWCISCKELENNTFTNLEVQDKLKNFILLQVDTTANSDDDKALLERFNLFGPPGIIFWKDKKELKNITTIGYKAPKEFLEILNKEF